MTKKLLSLAFAVVILAAAAFSGFAQTPAAAAESENTTGNIGFYVQAVLPENQIESNLSYFDLLMSPGSTQTLEVEIVNQSDEEMTVEISNISASTNRNGIIDYKTPGIKDISLKIPFSQITQLESNRITVAPNAKTTARAQITMPEESFDGVILGGLVFTRVFEDTTSQSEGLSLQNIYSYVIGVKLSETNAVVLPDFELDSIEIESVNYTPAIIHYIRNKEAAIVKGMSLNVVIRNSSNAVVAEIEKFGVDMAPNSVMPLAVLPADLSNELGEGDYTSDTTLELGGESWYFSQSFTIGSVEADDINGERPQADSSISATWLIILGGAALIIIALLLIIILLLRKKDERRNKK